MTDAPERIIASVDWEAIGHRRERMAFITVGTEGVPQPFEPTRYFSEDAVQAMVAAAYERDTPQGFFFDAQAALARIRADRIEALQAESLDWRAQVGELSDKCKALEAENARLRALLLEAASDLTVYVNSEYPPEICEKYLDIACRHHRDLELVRRISAALAQEGEG